MPGERKEPLAHRVLAARSQDRLCFQVAGFITSCDGCSLSEVGDLHKAKLNHHCRRPSCACYGETTGELE